MTRVMDGVRRTAMMPAPVVMAKPKPVVQPLPQQPRRYVVGMDGLRRPAPLSPREMLANMQAPTPAPAPAAVAAKPADPVLPGPALLSELTFDEPIGRGQLASPVAEAVSRTLEAARGVAWRRPAAAFGLVATALMVSSLGARALTAPRPAVAHATSAAHVAAKAPQPAKVAPAVAPAPQKTGLQDILNKFAAANPDKWGIVVKDLKTGETASVNPDRELTSASLYKLFVAQRIYQMIDIGQMDYNKDAGGGTGRNINDCLTIMINISDNACGRALGTQLGWGAQDQALKTEGYKNTTLVTPQQTSASDVATLFTRLYNGTLASGNSTQRFTDLLKSQRVNNRLPVGLPGGTVIAHKTGDLDGYVHDAGIVYGPKTDYLVVAVSGAWSAPGVTPAMFADLSTQVWNYFEN